MVGRSLGGGTSACQRMINSIPPHDRRTRTHTHTHIALVVALVVSYDAENCPLGPPYCACHCTCCLLQRGKISPRPSLLCSLSRLSSPTTRKLVPLGPSLMRSSLRLLSPMTWKIVSLGPSLSHPLSRLSSPTTRTSSFRDSPIAVAVLFNAEISPSGLRNRACPLF
jgi:hypothetical protein